MVGADVVGRGDVAGGADGDGGGGGHQLDGLRTARGQRHLACTHTHVHVSLMRRRWRRRATVMMTMIC